MKIYVRGNKWVLRALGATMTLAPLLGVSVLLLGAHETAVITFGSLALLATVAVIGTGVGIFVSTFDWRD